MTFDEWLDLGSPDNSFDFILAYPKLNEMPEWGNWKKRMDEVLCELPYEDAKQISLEDLISLAGLEGEIELARKKWDTVRRLENLEQDF